MPDSGARAKLGKKARDSYRRTLTAKQSELIGAIDRTELDGREAEDNDTQDMADQAANCYTKESLFQQSSHDRTLLNAVQEALQRLEEGSFGVCAVCEEAVDPKRLNALPWTS